MKLEIPEAELKPLIEQVVTETLAEIGPQQSQLNGRLAFDEDTAAKLLGISKHSLRDARLRGEVTACKIGKKILYEREALQRLLVESRISD